MNVLYCLGIHSWHCLSIAMHECILAESVPSFMALPQLNGIATKLVNKWLGLTKSTTAAVLHHPGVLDIPFPADFSFKAKLNYNLSAVTLIRSSLLR